MDRSSPQSMSSSQVGGILTPEERSILHAKLKDRQRELEETRRRADVFDTRQTIGTDAGDNKTTAAVLSESTGAKALLGEILQKLSETSVQVENTASVAASSRLDSPNYHAGELDMPITFTAQQKSAADTTITPKSISCFEKSVQVDELSFPYEEPKAEGGIHLAPASVAPRENKSTFISADEVREDEIVREPKFSKHENVEEVASTPPPVPTLGEEEIQNILRSVKFNEFFDRSTRLIERALGASEMLDLMVDYSGTTEVDTGESEEYKLTAMQTYFDGKWSMKRPLLDLRVSRNYNELFLAAYGPSEDTSAFDPDGCVLVWNAAVPQRPEYAFTYQSGVCSALFNEFQRNIIIGGTNSGSVVVWDMRAKSKPVQRTPVTSRGHTHPIFSTEIVGTQNAHNLVTVDTDGKLCQWSLAMLVNPSETVTLRRRNKEVSCGCISFPEGETNKLMGGLEDGSIFEAHIHGSKVGITQSYESHAGAVTGLQFHPHGEGNAEFSDLVLTSSIDWTVKLWSPRSHLKPLYTFDSLEDYVYDVKWHPSHPTVFVCVDGEGGVNIWNLAQDWEVAAFHTTAESAVNKVCWSSDGKRLISAERNSHVTIWNAAPEIYQPKADESEILEAKLIELKHEATGYMQYLPLESSTKVA